MDSDNDQHLRRYDGKLAFSASGRSFADLRQATAGSRIKKVLGKGGPFSEEFKAAILNDHEHVLERDYLLTELEAYKKVLVALEAAPQDPDAAKLLRRLRADPVTRKSSSTLCPIWRHENQTYNALTVTSRYAFPRVADELYLLTIVFDFAENIFQLEAKIREAHLRLNELVKRMTALRAGVMMVGCFEPDLFDGDELSSKESLRRMLADFSLRPGPSGGWVVTGHFFVRVPNKEAFEALLREIFPSRRWDRVRFDKIKKKKKLVATLMLILGYGAKYPRALFNVSLRGKKRKNHRLP